MTREANFIDKQKLIEAIEASTVEIDVITSQYYDFMTESHNIKDIEKMCVIDAHKLLEALK